MDVKTLCLAALSLREASGYEIKKLMDEPPFSHFQDTGFGSIYPALTRLAQEGLVEGRAQPQEKRPDKKVYRLTEAGRAQLCAALHQPPAPDKFKSDFFFLLFMSDLLPRAQVTRIVDSRLAEIDAALAEMERCGPEISSRGHRFAFALGWNYYTSMRRFLVDNRGWLEAETEPEIPRQVAE